MPECAKSGVGLIEHAYARLRAATAILDRTDPRSSAETRAGMRAIR